MAEIVILGAGAGGTSVAHRLARRFAREVASGATRITVVDDAPHHLMQQGLLDVVFGSRQPQSVQRPRLATLPPSVAVRTARVMRVERRESAVYLEDGTRLGYEILIIATGARIAPMELPGLVGPGWHTSVFDFYTLRGAVALNRALAGFSGGRFLIDIADFPIRNPAAPVSFACLADAYFRARAIREQVDLCFLTPLPSAYPRTVAGATLDQVLAERGITLIPDFGAARVDGVNKTLISWTGREERFDLLAIVPPHLGAEFVRCSEGLGDPLGFVLTEPRTLRARGAANIFALGDATNLPTAKTATAARYAARVVAENVARMLAGDPHLAEYDGHGRCTVATGPDRAIALDYNYDVEPLPGEYPVPGIGPLQLLHESRWNAIARQTEPWFYWHVLLPGLDIPGMSARFSMAGKSGEIPNAPPGTPVALADASHPMETVL